MRRLAPWRRSLHGRFVALVLRVAVLGSLLLAVAVYYYALDSQRSTGLDEVRGLVVAIDRTAAIGVYASDKVLLKEVADGLVRHPLVRRVQVEATGAGSMVSADDTIVLPGQAPGLSEPATAEWVLHSPFDATENIGRLLVWVDDQANARRARQQALLQVAATALLMAVVVVAFNIVALRTLSRPMHSLATQLDDMTPGSGQRLMIGNENADNELGTVVNAANALLEAHQHAIAQERTLRLEVAKMEAQYRQIFETTSAGIIVVSADGHLINSNRALSRLLGATDDDMAQLRQGDFARRVFCELERWHATVESARHSGAAASADLEVMRMDGSRRWAHCLVSVQEPTNQAQESIIEGVLYDVTSRRLAESQAARQAEIDALTGLPNRRGIERLLSTRIQESRDQGYSLTLLFIDLDGFKSVNDTLGHEAGDAVLIECAKRLSGVLRRKGDLVGRLGGDELVMLLDRAAPTEVAVHDMARAVIAEASRPFLVAPGRLAQIGASIGVAGFPGNAHDLSSLLRSADEAMYQAKRSGKNRFCLAATAPAEPAAAATGEAAAGCQTPRQVA
jgi:diguanylate cyclase (GGDEF)-like protein/PAS domain S-box-containing protein